MFFFELYLVILIIFLFDVIGYCTYYILGVVLVFVLFLLYVLVLVMVYEVRSEDR